MSLEVENVDRRDYLTSFCLASFANLLVLIPQYFTNLRLSSAETPIPIPAVAYWVAASYPLSVSVFLAMLPSILIFELIVVALLIWVRRVGDLRTRWRWKFRILSMALIVYVGIILGLDFLGSLSSASELSSLNIDTSQLLQTFYLFNLAAAICYLGLVLIMRRSYTRLSAAEAGSQITRNVSA